MDNLPMIQDKLNIFQKFRIRMYLMRRYSSSRFNNAPEYVKHDERVLRKMIKGEQSISFYRNQELIELFKNNSTLFDEKSKNQVIKYALENQRYDIILGLTDNEQYDIIMKKENSIQFEEMLQYASLEVVKRFISEERFSINFFSNSYQPTFLQYCNQDIQLEIISQNKELLQFASDDTQVSYLMNHEEDIELVHDDVKQRFLRENISFLNSHLEYVRVADRETQLSFASQNKNNLKYISEDLQVHVLEQHPEAFEYLESKLKKKLFNFDSSTFKYFHQKQFNIINELLDKDLKYFKFVGFDKNRDIVDEYLKYFQTKVSGLDIKTIKEYFIKSGLLSAKGSLRSISSSFFEGYERVDGQDIYSSQQINIIKQLDTKTICELIKIDANYVMPYITGRSDNRRQIADERFEECEARCKQVLEKLYGKEKFEKLKPCIEKIFNAQKKFQQNSQIEDLDGQNTYQFRIPLESLKLLFNQDIVGSNSEELINKYYSELFSNEEEKANFEQIIVNTYGDRAKKILESRKELDVYSINSLEIFDNRILDNFSEEFVHDLLSYNVRDFSTFLNIVKNEGEFSLFKQYYDMVSNLLGKNVETIQKAISEFYYNKELLENINNKVLNEEQYTNLISILSGTKNQFDIKTIDELDNYNEIANKALLEEIDSTNDIKGLILSNIFGIDKNIIFDLNTLYDMDQSRNIMTDSEREIIECINFIINEEDLNKLKQLVNELIGKQGIRNPVTLQTAITKVKEHSIEILNSRLLSKGKLDTICSDKQKSDNLRKENIDGVDIYYFEGFSLKEIESGFIVHNANNANGRDFMKNEGQEGMSTISARLYMDENTIIRQQPHYLFSEIFSEDLIAYQEQDAGIAHPPKLVKSYSGYTLYNKAALNKPLTKYENEVAFYRRVRNHDKRSAEKKDGRIKPSFICIVNGKETPGSVKDIPKEKLEYAKKYNIPIIVFKSARYQEKAYKESENKDGNER
mgnify:FL=1